MGQDTRKYTTKLNNVYSQTVMTREDGTIITEQWKRNGKDLFDALFVSPESVKDGKINLKSARKQNYQGENGHVVYCFLENKGKYKKSSLIEKIEPPFELKLEDETITKNLSDDEIGKMLSEGTGVNSLSNINELSGINDATDIKLGGPPGENKDKKD